MKKVAALISFFLVLNFIGFTQNKTKPIISSNNFVTNNQLWESIGNGVFNFQADVMMIFGKLYVTSIMPENADHKLPTLSEAYLYPLFNQFKKNNGEIVPGYSGDIYLILNLLGQPAQIYKELAAQMNPYAEMLTYYDAEGKKHQGKLRILVNDKADFEKINKIKHSFLGLVGNMTDIDKNIATEKMPVIEVNFDELTSWKGVGNIPFEDFNKIKTVIQKVHSQGKKISINNCPAHKTIAELIISSKADFINTVESNRMADFFDSIK